MYLWTLYIECYICVNMGVHIPICVCVWLYTHTLYKCTHTCISSVQFNRSVVSDSLQPPWTAAHQASPSITNSQSLLKLMSIESVMPSSHLILCRPLLLPPSILPSIRVFSNESVLHIMWPKCWRLSFSICMYACFL